MKGFDLELFDDAAFWRKVDKGPRRGCWIWLGHKPFVQQCGRRFQAHHVAYRLLIGPIEEGRTIRRTCGNDLCVNPEHLVLGRRYRIRDEFSGLKVSRQRKHQMRRQGAGKCLIGGCTEKPVGRTFCKRHLIERREESRVRQGCVKRYRTLSYK